MKIMPFKLFRWLTVWPAYKHGGPVAADEKWLRHMYQYMEIAPWIFILSCIGIIYILFELIF